MSLSQNHSIKLYFPYTFDSSAPAKDYQQFVKAKLDLKVRDLIEKSPYLKQDSHPKLLDSTLWKEHHCQLDKRFHGFSNDLINGTNTDNSSNGFFGLTPLALSPDAIRVLNQGSPNDLGCGVSISLKKASVARLAAQDIAPPLTNSRWPITINEIVFFGLNTGVGMLVVDLTLKQPQKNGKSIQHIEELLEVNYAIARNSNDHQSSEITWCDDSDKGTTLGLSDIVDQLLPTSINNSINLQATQDRNSTYTYTFIASDQLLDSQHKDDLIFRMARKYNDLYLPEDPQSQMSYFKPFKTITHAFCLEGATTYVDYSAYSDEVPESIKQFGKTAIPQAYAPLVLLTYAEYIFLREMATNSLADKKVDMRNPTSENLSRLRDFRSKLYDFRLNYRYTQISGNTNHNLFCNANKSALQIEQLLAETSKDVDEIEQYIGDFVSQQQEVRFKKFGVIGSLFAVIIGWVDLWGLTLNDIIYKEVTDSSSVLVFLGVLIVLAVSVIYSSRSSIPKKAKKLKPKKDNE